MAIADTSASRWILGEESAWGTSPAAGNYDELRVTGDSIETAVDTTSSEEIRSDRNPVPALRTAIRGRGDLTMELSAVTFKKLMEGVMQSDFATAVGGAAAGTEGFVDGSDATITAAAAGEFQIATADYTDEWDDARVGQWVTSTGSSASNDGIHRITAIDLVSDPKTLSVEGNVTLGAESKGTLAVHSTMIRIGTTKKSYTLERGWTDIGLYQLYAGMRVARWDLTFATGSVIGGAFGFLGKKEANGASSVETGTPTTPGAGKDIMDPITSIDAVYEGVTSAASSLQIAEITFSQSNQLREQLVINAADPAGIGVGTVQITGTMRAYLENATFIDKFVNNTPSLAAVALQDQSGNSIVVTMPKLRFTSGRSVLGGNAADGIVEMAFQAETDTNGVGFQLDLYEA